jgi:hypothetical protein
LENTVERKDIRDGGRGMLFLTGGRDLTQRKKNEIEWGMRDRGIEGLKDRGREERDAEEEKELGNF